MKEANCFVSKKMSKQRPNVYDLGCKSFVMHFVKRKKKAAFTLSWRLAVVMSQKISSFYRQ